MNPLPSTSAVRNRLRSSSGAFDLPSIIVGVVVVGILTAGVLAAIFGIIPFVQDNAAKQDLSSINTAQGTTYAKDEGQTYKDMAGLEQAGLISDLDRETTQITVPGGGKGFTAIVKAGSGKSWYITHDNSTPRELGGSDEPVAVPEPDGEAVTGLCTPAVVAALEHQMSAFTQPGAVEFVKSTGGLDFDYALVEAWVGEYLSGEPGPLPLSDEESETFASGWAVFEQDHMMVILTASLDQIPRLQAEAAAKAPADLRDFCASYTGPAPKAPEAPEFEAHSSHPDTFHPYVQALTGSTEPVVFGYTFETGGADDYDISVLGADAIPGFASSANSFEMVDGKGYWTTALHPGPGGWGSSTDAPWIYLEVTHRGYTDGEESKPWQVKANSNVVDIVDPAPYEKQFKPNLFRDTWDNRSTHTGATVRFNYGIDQPNGAVEFTKSNTDLEPRVLSATPGMKPTVRDERENKHGNIVVEGENQKPLPIGSTVTVRQYFIHSETYARAWQDYTYTVVDPATAEQPRLQVSHPYHRQYPFEGQYRVELLNPYNGQDYDIEATYDGKPVGDNLTVRLGDDHGAYVGVYSWQMGNQIDFANLGSEDSRKYIFEPWYSVYDYEADEDTPPRQHPTDIEIKVTHRPSGQSTTVNLSFPQA